MNDTTKITGKDALYAAAKAGLSSIPLLGAAASELFGLVITPPLEKRRGEWMNNIADKLKALEEKQTINFEELSTNQQFVDTVVQATAFAIKTSQIEKIDALRNAVINTAKGDCPDIVKSQIFLHQIDVFTVWHIKFLSLFDNPLQWFEKGGQATPRLMMGSLFSVIKVAFPSFAGEGELADLIWNDLHVAGFHRTSDLRASLSGDGLLQERTSQLGKEFLHFISDHT